MIAHILQPIICPLSVAEGGGAAAALTNFTNIDLNPFFQMPTVPRMFEAAPVKFKQAGGLKPATLEKLEELEELVSKEQVCFWLSWFGIYVTRVFSVTLSKTSVSRMSEEALSKLELAGGLKLTMWSSLPSLR